MQIVIDISDDLKDKICNATEEWAARYVEGWNLEIARIIRNGTPIPEGEWIDHSEDYGYVECPVCEHLTNCEGNKDELHYCWYCGSRMGKVLRNE